MAVHTDEVVARVVTSIVIVIADTFVHLAPIIGILISP
ncbi:unnamed protein product [Camellia sinensis]